MLGVEVETALERMLQELPRLTPKLRLVSLTRQATIGSGNARADIVAQIVVPCGDQFTLVVEAKSSGEPRIARLAASQLQRSLARHRCRTAFLPPPTSPNQRDASAARKALGSWTCAATACFHSTACT